MSFQSSLKPFLIWMRCLGIYLIDIKGATACFPRMGITFIGVVLIFLNLMCNGMQLASIVATMLGIDDWGEDRNRNDSSVSVMNVVIAQLSHCFASIFPHLHFMSIAVFSPWSKILDVLRKMEKERFFKRQDYDTFRYIFATGCAILLIVNFNYS